MQINREKLKLDAANTARRWGRRLGLHVLPADFNSPIVDAESLPPSIWDQADPMPGLEFDLDRQIQMIDEHLSDLVAEFRPPVKHEDNPLGFYLENEMYGPMDAHILYAMLRDRRPRRVLEFGSGFSTLVIQEALAANASPECEHHVVDPFLSPLVQRLESAQRTGVGLRLYRQSGAAVGDELLAGLDRNDVLFVDTSHTVKPGGEVVRLVLEGLAALRPGVMVHFHDIYRPFVYPRVFYDYFNMHWQEQYLVQAFLSYNRNFQVVCANHALWRLRRTRVRTMFDGLVEGREPSGFWFERVGPEHNGRADEEAGVSAAN